MEGIKGYRDIIRLLKETKRPEMEAELFELLGFEIGNIQYIKKIEMRMMIDRLKELK